MPFTLTMPKLSPTMEAGTIAKWMKKVGDHVKAGDVLFTVATDKATVEHSALDEGWLRSILVQEGHDAVVNQPVAIFTETKDESIEGYKPEGVSLEQPKAKEEQGQIAAKEEKIETPKAYAGSSNMQQPSFAPEAPLQNYAFSFPTEPVEGRIMASPLAKKLAKEKGVDLTTVKGSGPHQRIMSRDLELGLPAADVSFGRRETPKEAPGSYEEISLTPMRKVIGQRLQQSKTFVPHFYVGQEISADALVVAREQLKTGGIKVSFNDFVIRACALALRHHPEVNSGYHSSNASIIRFKTIDISIAVSMEAGLITPIIRHADYKNLGEISAEMKNLAERARQGKLVREEYMGGSFSISNLGMYGISDFVAVINPPQAAILAVGGIEEKAIVKQGNLAVGKTMHLTLSGDHRVIDGVNGAKFLKTLQKYLENPALLVM